MKPKSDAIWVRRGLERMAEVRAFLDAYPETPRVCFGSPSELKEGGVFTGGKTPGGKLVLVIDRGAGSLLELDAPLGFSE